MAKPKTKVTEASVDSFLNGVADVQQRADAFPLLGIMKETTGKQPKLWGLTMERQSTYRGGLPPPVPLRGHSPTRTSD
jgi:hypothetical protein